MAMTGDLEDLLAAVSQLTSNLQRLESDFARHVAQGHESLVTRDELARITETWRSDVERWRADVNDQMTAFRSQQDMLADVLLGVPQRNYDGEVVRVGGVKQFVDQYTSNGGITVKLPWAKLTGLVATVIGVIGSVVVAIIENMN